MDNKTHLKIVVIGDVGSGKTWLWQSHFQNRKPPYEQTIFDNYCCPISYNGQEVKKDKLRIEINSVF